MLIKLKVLTLFSIGILALLTSCVSQERIAGLRLIDAYGNVCVFEASAAYRRAYVGAGCKRAALGKTGAIVMEDDVDLSARDLTAALEYLRQFAENQCRRNEGKEFIQCLRGVLPNHVTSKNKCFVFWYGRNSGDGFSGFPVGVVRTENGFSAPDSTCE